MLALAEATATILVHSFDYATHDVNLTSTTDGNTRFTVLPDGESTPSTITAEGISPIAATVNENGDANLSGSVNGSHFEVVTTPDGNTTITYTNAQGETTTATLPHPGDVVINSDGSIDTAFPLIKDFAGQLDVGEDGWTYDPVTQIYTSHDVINISDKRCLSLAYSTASTVEISFEYDLFTNGSYAFFYFPTDTASIATTTTSGWVTHTHELPPADHTLQWCAHYDMDNANYMSVDVRNITLPTRGSLTINPDGSVSYTGKDGNAYTQDPGVDMAVIEDDVIVLGKEYTVVWDYLGGTSGGQGSYTASSVPYGSGATHTPDDPTKPRFFMQGWHKPFGYVTRDLTIHPLWKPDEANTIADHTTLAEHTGGHWYTKPIDYNDDTNTSHQHTLNYYDDGTATITASGGGDEALVHEFDYAGSHNAQLTQTADGNTTFATTPQGGTEGASTVRAQGIHDLETTVDEQGRTILSGSVNGISFEAVTNPDGTIRVTYTDSNGKETVVEAPYASHVLIDPDGKLTVTTGSVDEDGNVTLADGEKSVVLEDTTTTVTEKVDGQERTVTLEKDANNNIDVSADFSVVVSFDPNGGERHPDHLGIEPVQTLAVDTSAEEPVLVRNCSDGTTGCFTFAGWDSAFDLSEVIEDLNITARWSAANGVIDSLTPGQSGGGHWHTKPLDYSRSSGTDQNTTIKYFQDESVNVDVSGGDKDGNPLVHTFSGYDDGQTVALENHSDGNTRFATTPAGESEPSTLTAEAISPIEAKVDEEGTATLSGFVNGSTFKAVLGTDGSTTITYTNAEGEVTTVTLPYKNDVVINSDGSITATSDDVELTINPDGSTTFTDKEGEEHTAPAGSTLKVTDEEGEKDVEWVGKKYTVTFRLNGGTLEDGSLTQSIDHGQSATAPAITREGYTLSWDGNFTYVNSSRTIEARWTPGPGVIDTQALETTTDGNWHTKPIDYTTTDGADQNTTLKYFNDGSIDVAMSGGEGKALVHNFSGYGTGHEVALTNKINGTTQFATTPDGQKKPSTLTAEGISPIEAKVDEAGTATLSGDLEGDKSFTVTTSPEGNTTVTYTNANGDVTTIDLSYPNDVLIGEDGTLTATHGDREVTLHPDGTTTYQDKHGNSHTQAAGESISVTAADVLVDKSFAVVFDARGGYRTGGGDLNQTIDYAQAVTAPDVNRTGYDFATWEGSFDYITADTNVTAVWFAHPGTIDPDIEIDEDENRDGWHTKSILYTTEEGDQQATTLHYYQKDDEPEITVDGGDGAALTHTFDYAGGHEVVLTNEINGTTHFATTPDGAAEASTITAEGISPIEAIVDENGHATLEGSVAGIDFNATIAANGDVTVVYTDSNGKETTITAPHPSDVVINPDGSIHITDGEKTVVLDDTSTSITTDDGTIDLTNSGLDGIDITGTYAFEVSFDPNGGYRIIGGGELSQTVPIGQSATEPTVRRFGYEFDGWNVDFDMVDANLTIIAQWREAEAEEGEGTEGYGVNIGESSTADGKTEQPITATSQSGLKQEVTLVDDGIGAPFYQSLSGDGMSATTAYSGTRDGEMVEMGIVTSAEGQPSTTLSVGQGGAQQAGWTSYAEDLSITPSNNGQINLQSSSTLPGGGVSTLEATLYGPDGETGYTQTNSSGIETKATSYLPVEGTTKRDGTTRLEGEDFNVTTYPGGTGLVQMAHGDDNNISSISLDEPGSTTVIKDDGTIEISYPKDDGSGEEWVVELHPNGTITYEDENGVTQTLPEGSSLGFSSAGISTISSSASATEASITRTNPDGSESQSGLVDTSSGSTGVTQNGDGSYSTSRTDAEGSSASGTISPTGQASHRVEPAGGAPATTAQSQIAGATTTLSDEGVNTAIGGLSDGDGGTVDLSVSATNSGAATHRMDRTDSSGNSATTNATSEKPGANTTIGTDGEGKPYILTTLDEGDKHYQVEATADGQASHALTTEGTTTRADTNVTSADIQTRIDESGAIATEVQPTADPTVRAIVHTLPNGESLTRFERFNSATGAWEVILPTVHESTPFERGNRSIIKEHDDDLEIEVTSDVTRILRF